MKDLIFISGARSGLGGAVFEALHTRQPAPVPIVRRAIERWGGPQITADLAQPQDWAGLLAPFLSKGGFDRLVFLDIAAVLAPAGVLVDGFDAGWQEAMMVNCTNPLSLGRELGRAAAQHGVPMMVSHVSSGAALRPIPGWGAYCASKAAAAMAWRNLAQENAHVTAHIFQPGVIDTAMQAELRGHGDAMAAPSTVLRSPDEVARDMLDQCGLAGDAE